MKTRTLLRRKQVLNHAWSVSNNPACELLESRMLLAAPTVAVVSPYNAGSGVGVSAKVSVMFDQAMNATTISSNTFQLFDSANTPITGRISYNSVNKTATFDANTPLSYSTTYHAVVVGGTSGVKNSSNQALGANVQWSFTTAAAPTQGQGGPILVVTDSSNSFGSYYAEILRAEGLNSFATSDVSTLSGSLLSSYGVVILGQTTLTTSQVTTLTDWVTNGGNLIAMRPDKKLAGLLGLSDAGTTQTEGYLLVNTASGPGVGITAETMQYHGTADKYTLNGATSIATLYSSASTATNYPAVTIRSVGTQGGQAAAFTFDLARSIVYTRQGNPAWAGQERDNDNTTGADIIRSDDLFYSDWVDLNKVSIPQADEEQRLLANMITQMDLDKMPLPRFWYLPNGAKAALIMTGDDHAAGGLIGRFDNYLSLSSSGSSVSDWTAIRGTTYMYASTSVVSDEEAAYYTANGFEIALHVNNGPRNFTSYTDLEQYYDDQLSSFAEFYPSIPTPVTHRMHAIVWSDYATQPQVEFAYRIRLDTNYYYYPNFWVNNRPGFFTGSGMPMRFATADGQILDVYQVATEMTDESGQTYPFTIDSLLGKAMGSQGYYGMFCANIHTDSTPAPGESDIIASARANNVPIISSKQALDWTDGRNGSSFNNLSWNSSTGTLNFSIATAVGANGLQAMLPVQSANGVLNSIKRNGAAVSYTTQTIKGVDYAFFATAGGDYSANYSTPVDTFSIWSDSSTPSIPAVSETGAIELGVKFRADVDGYITGIRFYKGDGNGGTHIGSLWDKAGNKLASATFVNETTTGWQTVYFDSPVAITANTTYVASYFASQGHYSASGAYFSAGAYASGHLSALASNDPDGSNGVFHDGSSAFPSTSYNATNYWVDVLFTTSNTDTQPPIVSARTPAADATNVPISTTVQVTFSEAVDAATVNSTNLQLKSGSTIISASVNYDPTTHIATLSPTAALLNSTTYTVTVGSVKDLAGNTMAGTTSWQFTTAAAGINGHTIWSDSVIPTSAAYNDNSPYELGTKFQAKEAGTITGIRFYKGVTNPDTYLGNLWDSAGNRLATATFTNTTSTGWQTVYFSSPVAIAANTTYIASYHTSGYYVADTTGSLSFVSSGVTNYPLYALKNGDEGANGVYASGATSAFPNQATPGFNYWVDVIFVSGTDTTPPTVTAQTPTNGATNVPVATTVTVTFSEAMDSATISGTNFQLTSGSTVVPATVDYNSSTHTATLTPSAPLTGSTTYTVTIAGAKDLAGNVLTPAVSWTFTTAVVDTTPPTVTGQTPANATTNVPITTTVTVTFSEAVDSTTVINNFQLKNGSTVVPATVSYDPVTHIATLTPTISLASSTTYTASVSGVKDLAGNAMTGSVTWSFTTADTVAPTVIGQTPSPNATNVPVTTTVTVTFSEAMNTATISGTNFQLTNGATVVPASVNYNSSTHTATLTPSASLAGSTTYTATIAGAKDLAGNVLTPAVSWSFTTAVVDTTPPTVTGQTPANAATNVPASTTVTVTFSEAVDSAMVINNFQLKNGSTVVPATVTYNATTHIATLTPSNSLAASTTYTASVSGVRDLAGNTMAGSVSWTFTTAAVDTTPPTVTAQTPLDAAINVPANTKVTVTFSEAVDSTTVINNLQLKNGATTVSAAVTYDAATRIATLTPNNALGSLTQYTASISGVKDLVGNTMAGTVSWSFTVADTQAPTVTGQTPSPNATNVSLATTVTVTFSKAMDAATITPTSFQLKNGSTVVPATVSYDPVNHIATLTPISALADSTTYTVTISGVKDLAGNALAATNWSFTTVDSTAPTVTGQSPAPSDTNVSVSTSVSLTFSEAVQWNLASFELRDAANALVSASVTYNATTRTATLVPTSALANSATYTARVSGVVDLAGNALSGPVSWSFTTAAPLAGTYSFWSSAATPQIQADPDTSAVELGVKFRSDVAGYITGIRFYKGSSNTGTHTGSLWTRSGTRLASVTFSNETASGWQTASFSTPVLIAANTTYVASYFAPKGHYAADDLFFTNAGADNGPLHALKTGVDGGNGVYRYGASSGFPGTAYNGTNYWVDVIFAASLADTQAPSVISRSPLNGSSNVPTTSAVTATFSEAVDSTTVINNFQLKNGSTVVPATVTYDSATHVATLTPTTALAGSTTYTVTINGVKDLAGNVMAGSDTWSFTTVAVDTQAPTVISQSPAPDATGVATGSSVRATFSEPIDSTTYSFVLQGPGGSPISASVSYDSSSRTLTLMPTAALAASTSYTALLSGAKDLAGNLMAPVSWSFTTASTVVPTVVAESPAPNDLNVSLSTPVTATFNEPVVSTSLVFALRDPNNNLVATTFVYDSTTQTASWTPSSPLASQTTYTATLSAATDAAGNSLSAPVSWSFTTLDAQPPSIVNQSPAAGATGVALTTSITVTFSEPVQSSSISLLLRDPANQPVAGNLTYNESTRTATFTPSAPLAVQVTFTVSVSGAKDLAGNALVNPLSWSFTTAGSTGTGPYSLFSTTAIPAVAADPDASAVEVGVRFSSDLSGYITGVRFYKGSGNSGTHIGNLWSSSGTLMATATFSSESASGWQTVMFSSPVAIIADTTYVASYFAPSGHYSVSETYFENGLDNAPLHVPANGDGGSNGVYRYGSRSGFPSSGYMASNYWVDVLFSTVYIDNVAPSVIATTPASGSTNNALTTSLTAKFSESVQSSSISFVLRDPSNNIVPGVVSYDDSTKTATLKPSSALLANTTYTATVSDARDLAGNPMNGPVTWSFGSADTIAPTIISQSPAPDATGVTGKTVRVVFSEAMTSSSITTTTFQLLDSTNTIVAATVSYNATTRTATLTASGNLKAGSTYTVRVVGGASGVKDSAGNALAADVVWTFAAA